MYKEVGMACQEVCKQVRNDIKVKVVYKLPSLHHFTLHCKRCRDGRSFVYYLHFYITSNLFLLVLDCILFSM